MKAIKFYLRAVALLLMLVLPAQAADVITFYHTDPIGTPLAISDSSGKKVWGADYKPFGEEYSINGTQKSDKRFAGKEKDTETGLNYFVARYMAVEPGRFLAVEPVRGVDEFSGQINALLIASPQAMNVYAYSLNNPYKYVDSDGNSPLISDGPQHSVHKWNAGIIRQGAGGTQSGNLNANASRLPGLQKVNGRTPINSKYAGKTHPSGVRFKETGYPDFKPYAKAEVKIRNLTGDVKRDSAMANKAIGRSQTPKDHTWHHVEDGITMQLVPRKIHQSVRHTGGSAVLREINKNMKP